MAPCSITSQDSREFTLELLRDKSPLETEPSQEFTYCHLVDSRLLVSPKEKVKSPNQRVENSSIPEDGYSFTIITLSKLTFLSALKRKNSFGINLIHALKPNLTPQPEELELPFKK